MISNEFINEKNYITFTGKKCTKDQVIGYCWSDLHKGYITKQIMDQHKCLKKQCQSLQKFPESQYWVKKEKVKKKRLAAKAQQKKLEKQLNEYLKKIQDLTFEDKDFYAISIEKEKNIFIVTFIKFKNIDYGKYIKLFSINCDNEKFLLKEIKNNRLQKLKIIEALKIPKNFEKKEN